MFDPQLNTGGKKIDLEPSYLFFFQFYQTVGTDVQMNRGL